MKRVRFSKVRVTDYRPAGVGRKSALEAGRLTRGGSVSKTDRMTASQAREAAEHDRAVADYSPRLVEAAWNDLAGRVAYDWRDPEARWVMASKAALRRLGASMREGRLA